MKPTEKSIAILAAARRLFAKNGFKATTTKDIATEAGVNEVTIFRLFGNKKVLLDKMLEFYVVEPDTTELSIRQSGNLEDYLNKVGSFIYGVFTKYIDLFNIEVFENGKLSDRYQISKLPNGIRNIAKEQFITYFGMSTEDADTTAVMYISSIHGLCINSLYLNTWEPVVDSLKCIQMFSKKFSSLTSKV